MANTKPFRSANLHRLRCTAIHNMTTTTTSTIIILNLRDVGRQRELELGLRQKLTRDWTELELVFVPIFDDVSFRKLI